MNFEQLEAVEAIVERGSFRAGATQLGKTQSTISTAIKNLEKELGFVVFHRTAYNVSLTEDGKTLYKTVKKTLKLYRELLLTGKNIGDKEIETEILISLDPSVSTCVFKTILDELAKISPTTKVAFKTSHAFTLMDEVSSELCDLGIGLQATTHSSIDSIPFGYTTFFSAATKELYDSFSCEEDLILQIPQVVVYNSNQSEFTLCSCMHEPIHEASSQIYVTDHFLKMRLIESGLAWGRVADYSIYCENKTKYKLIQKTLFKQEYELFLMKKQNTKSGKAIQGLWDYFSINKNQIISKECANNCILTHKNTST